VKKKRIVANKKPKNTFRLPDLDQAKTPVLNSLPSKEPQRGYPGPPARDRWSSGGAEETPSWP
jgi:hypothetical protein